MINVRNRLFCTFALCLGLSFPANSSVSLSTEVGQPAKHQYGADVPPERVNDGWATVKPSKAGFDPRQLALLTGKIESGEIHNVHAVIVARNGELVYERYFPGDDQRWGSPQKGVKFSRDSLHDLRSVTKSVATAVLGIALAGRHREALARPITTFFPHLQGKVGPSAKDIKLEHVVTMTAGLEWNEMEIPYTDATNDENRLDAASDPIEMVLSRPVRHLPGSTWYYNGGLAQVVAGVIRQETGLPIHKFAQQALFEPLGISSFEWLGSGEWDIEHGPSAASGLRMRARDLAKIGSVFLHKGKWNGKQMIPQEWVELSFRPYVKEIKWGRSTGVYGYGFMWYPGVTNDEKQHRLFRAAGNGNQRIFILPDLGLNIVVYAGNYNDYSHKSDAKVLRGVLTSLAR